MNTFRNIFIIILVALFSTTANAEESKSKKIKKETFTVNGVCGMCEKRIENAALIKGVIKADWDKHAQEIEVIYRTKKVDVDDIHKAIAEAGHDTSKKTADDKAYISLPDCCAYRDGVDVH